MAVACCLLQANRASAADDDDRVIRRPGHAAAAPSQSPARPRTPVVGLGLSAPTNWLMPLFLVIGLLGMALLLRRRHAAASGPRRSPLLDVLGRVPLSARQTLYLVRVGRRVVLLGATSDQVRTLIDVNDPVEAAEIVGAAAQARGGSLSSQFTDFLKNAAAPFREPEPPAAAVAPRVVDEARGGIEQLRRQVRGFAMNATA